MTLAVDLGCKATKQTNKITSIVKAFVTKENSVNVLMKPKKMKLIALEIKRGDPEIRGKVLYSLIITSQ